MKKRLPIQILKDISKKYNLTHLVLYAFDKETNVDHVVTYGKDLTQCHQAANFGNQIKKFLGWPDKLQAQPRRIKKLQNTIKKQQEMIDKLKSCHNCFYALNFSSKIPDICKNCKKKNNWELIK
jgi:formate dehydrogenase assembly factor FdhD